MSAVLENPLPAPVERHYTPHDLERLEDQGLYELVRGQLVEKELGYLSSKTAGLIVVEIGSFLRNGSIVADVLPEEMFRIFPEEDDRVRRPDIAVLVGQKFPPGTVPSGPLRVRPDIAIEVVSPSDRIYDFEEKLQDYRSAKIPLVWVVYPVSRIVRVHRLDRTVTELHDADHLTGESILPGFSVLVSSILPPK